MRALVEAFAVEPRVDHVNLVQQHFRQLAEKAQTLVAFAMVRARMGLHDEARTLLAELEQLPSDTNATQMADVIRARLRAVSESNIRAR